MRFCPFCSAENTVEATHCAACNRRLPPVPQRRRTATSQGEVTVQGPPPTMPRATGGGGAPSAGAPSASPNDSGRRSLLAALSPSPAAERRPPAPSQPPRPGGARRTDFDDSRTVVDGRAPAGLDRAASPVGGDTMTIDEEWGLAGPTVADPSPRGAVPTPPHGNAAPPSGARRPAGNTQPPPLPPRKKPSTSSPPPLPPSASGPHAAPPLPGPPPGPNSSQISSASLPAPSRTKRPSMSPPLYPAMKEQRDREAAAAAANAANQSGSGPVPTAPLPPAPTAPMAAPPVMPPASRPLSPSPPVLPQTTPRPAVHDTFEPLPTPLRNQLQGQSFEPPPTRILRGDELGDRPFAPPHVIPVPELPEPGLISAARYAITFLRARWQRRGAIKSLAEDIKRDTDALDQILGSLGRAARAVGLEGRVFAGENAAISAAEARRASLENESVELQTRRSDESTKYVDVENDRTTKVSQAEHQLGEAQRDMQLLEGQRRNAREERKRIEARQKGYLKAAEQREEQARDAPMGQQRGFHADAESHRKSAAELEPARQELDRKLAALEKPIADCTARVEAAKAELESARRSADDAREGHGHRLAELEAETKRKAKDIAQAEAEIVRRLVTLGTLVNLNRVEQAEFSDLYLRIDRLRTAIGARTTEIEKLTAERDAYDKPSLLRGIATIGGSVVVLIGLIVLLRACI
jgi:hypothetical protein